MRSLACRPRTRSKSPDAFGMENAAANFARGSGEPGRIAGYGRLSIGTRRELATSPKALADGERGLGSCRSMFCNVLSRPNSSPCARLPTLGLPDDRAKRVGVGPTLQIAPQAHVYAGQSCPRRNSLPEVQRFQGVRGIAARSPDGGDLSAESSVIVLQVVGSQIRICRSWSGTASFWLRRGGFPGR